MIYNDEQIMSIEGYELAARAYREALKQSGLFLTSVGHVDEALVEETFLLLSKIKAHLLGMGGFMNTSRFYSLNERQIKKLGIIFDREAIPAHHTHRDKTKNFLQFLSCEFKLIKNMTALARQSHFEKEISVMTNDRLLLLSQLLSVYG